MKTQIDLKSALCGLVLGVLAMLVIGAETSSDETGRYHIACGSGFSVMVDTKTGQAWYCPGAALNRNDINFFEPKQK